jgi:hypothetical protein
VNSTPAASRRWQGLVPVALAHLLLSGCANFWDDVTSRDFKMADLWSRPDPMTVLEKSTDGDKKARALRSLDEPLTHGGSQQDQDRIVDLLVQTATRDPQAWCRQAAIDTLRKFKDPRAVAALKTAYYNADAFPPETSAPLRCQVLAALGDTGNPAAVDLLVTVLREPPVEGPEVDKQQKNDERIAAARALANFQQGPAAEALLAVLRAEPDNVALRDRAGESLVKITGKDLPAEPQAWDDYLHHSAPRDGVANNGVGEKFLRLISGNGG